MAALQGYRTQQKIGQSQFQTYQQVGRAGSGSYAADTVSKVLWDTTPLNVAVEADSTKLVINATAHTAVAGDMIRFVATSANPGIEVGVVKVTANTIELGGELPALPLLADEFKIMRWITPTADQNGNLVFTPGPTTFSQNGVITTAAEDTANPANNKGLPVNIVFYKDGVPVTVNVDSVTPANNRLLPVELSSLAGPINVTAGDLNVNIESTNDSTAIGDGITGDLAKVDLNDDATTYALKVKDDDANGLLSSIDGEIIKLSNTQNQAGTAIISEGLHVLGSDGTDSQFLKTNTLGQLEVIGISAPLPTDAATESEQQAQTALLTTIDADTSALSATVNTDGNPVGTTGIMLGGKDDAGDFQQLKTNTDGDLRVTFGTAGFATETTLAALNNKVANDYGASLGAVRTAAQLGNTTGQADFGVGADSAQTLRVSANLKRAGNELSYNSGATDANTLRSVLATRHEAAATPLAARLSNGTNFIAFGSGGSTAETIRVVPAADYVPQSPAVPSAQTPKQAAVTFGASAVRLTHDGSAPNANRRSLKFIIEPFDGEVNYFMGSSTVTSSGSTRGIRLYPGTLYDFPSDANDYYIISDTAAQTVFILEVES